MSPFREKKSQSIGGKNCQFSVSYFYTNTITPYFCVPEKCLQIMMPLIAKVLVLRPLSLEILLETDFAKNYRKREKLVVTAAFRFFIGKTAKYLSFCSEIEHILNERFLKTKKMAVMSS